MGNNTTKHHIKDRPKKNVHWKSAEPPSAPGKPVLVTTIDTTPDVITLQWIPPRIDGGSPIIGYLVEHRRTGSPHWVRATPSLIPYPELSLSGLEPGWRYQFRVSAENAVGASEPSELSDPLTVTLQRNAIVPPRFLCELHDAIALENEKVEFNINALGTPPPQINWFKDGFEIFSSRRTKIINENNTSTLIIHQAALTDEGEIKCTATNRAGHVVTRAQLKLEAPPKIRLPRQYEDGLLIEAEEIIRLKVGIAGRPPPNIVWTHNGEVIRNGSRYELITTDKNSSLKITNSKRSDRGEYNLRAINKIGEDNASFLVTVTAKPSPPGKIIITMSLGRTVTLSWTAPEDDGGCKIGNYIVEYYRIGWNVWLKALTTRQLSATISDLIEGSEYKFRVKAENPYGLSEPCNESNILFVPDPKRGIHHSSDENSFEFLNNSPTSITPMPLTTSSPPSPLPPMLMPRHRKTSSNSNASSKNSLDMEHTLSVSPGRCLTKVDKQEQTVTGIVKQHRQKTQVAPIIQLSPNVNDSEKFAREMSYGTSDDIFNRKKDYKPLNRSKKIYEDHDYDDVDNDDGNIFDKYHGDMVKNHWDTILMDDNRKQQINTVNQFNNNIINSESENFVKGTVVTSTTPAKLTTTAAKTTTTTTTTISNSPVMEQKKYNLDTPRESGDEVHTSNEFVLVLYDDDKKQRNRQGNKENISFEFELEDSIIPPPLSLSAPELSVEPPSPPILRRSISSTELLYERAMARFYQAVELEEAENARRKSISIEPKQQQLHSSAKEIIQKRRLSDIDRQSSFERKNLLKKRLSSDISPEILNDLQHKLDNNKQLNKLIKQNSEDDNDENNQQNKTKLERQYKESEEYDDYDEDDYEDDDCINNNNNNIRNIKYKDYVDNELLTDANAAVTSPLSSIDDYEDDYTDSTASSSSIDSIEKFKKAVANSPRLSLTTQSQSIAPSPSPQPLTEDELDTYHPRMEERRALSPYRTPEPNQSTIVLTKPLPLPSPDFIPKPILKRPSVDNNSSGSGSVVTSADDEIKVKKETKKKSINKPERKSLLQIFERNKKASPPTSAENDKIKSDEDIMKKTEKQTKLEMAKKKGLENRQNSLEENKVVIEYYSDIVKEMGNNNRKPKVPIYMSSEELKRAAEKAEEEERLLIKNIDNENMDNTFINISSNNINNNSSSKEELQNAIKSENFDNVLPTSVTNKILEKTTRSNSQTHYSMELLPGCSKEAVNVVVTKSTTKTEIIDDIKSKDNLLNELIRKSSLDNITSAADNIDNERMSRKHQSNEQLGIIERGRSKNTGAIPKKRSQSGSVTRRNLINAPPLSSTDVKDNDIISKSKRNISRTRIRSESKSPSAVKNRIALPNLTKVPPRRISHLLSSSSPESSSSQIPSPSPTPSLLRSHTPEQFLQEEIEIKVKSTMAYITDLAIFFVACWIYIFKDAKLVIPIIALMVYRQIGDALKDKLPKWMKRKRD